MSGFLRVSSCPSWIARFSRILACGLLFGLAAAPASAADYELRPAITVSEEFTDNVFESRDNREFDFITRLLPGVAFKYKAPFWDWDVGYSFDYRIYARDTRDNDSTHNLAAKGTLRLIDNFLFLDLSDDYNRVSLDVARDVSRESLFINQSDQNVFSASPYIKLQPTEVLVLSGGYRYVNTWYEESSAVDKENHIGFAQAIYEVSDRWNFSTGYTFTKQETRLKDYEKHDGYVGTQYTYADQCYVYGQAGHSRLTYNTGEKDDNPFWNAGITHTFDTLTVNLGTSVLYAEDPLNNIAKETAYFGNIQKLLKRGTVGLSLGYSEFEKNETDLFNIQRPRDTKRYSGIIKGTHHFNERITGELALTGEKYDQENVVLLNTKGSTRKIFVDGGVTYILGEQATTSLFYRYVDYYSRDIPWDNKEINRVIVQFSLLF